MNTPNYQVVDREGNSHWISRSCAVCVIPFFSKSDLDWYVPVGKRSSDLELFPGFFGLPGGYLDWGETLAEAGVREVQEELGLNLYDYGGLKFQPDFVQSSPYQDEKQNITHRFIFHQRVKNLPPLKPSEETPEVKWLPLGEIIYERLAFNHNEIIRWAYGQLNL